MMGLNRYDLVIFDLDGTLLDTIGDLAQAVNHCLRIKGYPEHTVPEYKLMVGHGIRNLVYSAIPSEYRGDQAVVESCLADFVEYYTAHIQERTVPYDGVHDIMRRLQDRGVAIAVASNKFQAGAEALTAHFFPDVDFCAVLGNRSDLPLKPDPAVIDFCISKAASAVFGTPARDRVVMVGDSATDIKTAKNAGIASIGVTWGFRDEDELRSAGADIIATNPEELFNNLLYL